MPERNNNAAVAARAVARRYTDVVLRLPNVIGCGVSRRVVGGRESDEWCFVTFVSHKVPAALLRSDELVPRELRTPDGVARTDVVETAEPQLLVDKKTYRPLIGGSQILSQSGTGTLGAVVYDGTDYQPVLLTCNHCLTLPGQRSFIPTDTRVRQPASVRTIGGVAVIQPGGSMAGPVIGRTKRIAPWFPPPLGETTANFEARVDAGIVGLLPNVAATSRVIDLGKHPYVFLPPFVGLEVVKRGFRTELTRDATVKAVDVTITVTDFNGQRVRIGGVDSGFAIKAAVGTTFAARGDSGSLIVDADLGAARGILFAGDWKPGGWVYACELGAIFAELRLETPCTGGLHAMIRRAVLRRHFSAWTEADGSGHGLVGEMVRKTDRFRHLYLPEVPNGRVSGALGHLLEAFATDLAEAIQDDEEFAGLLDVAFGDWLVRPTIYDMLEYRLPDDFGERVLKAFGRLRTRGEVTRDLGWLRSALAGSSGRTMREFLRVAVDVRPRPKVPTSGRRRR